MDFEEGLSQRDRMDLDAITRKAAKEREDREIKPGENGYDCSDHNPQGCYATASMLAVGIGGGIYVAIATGLPAAGLGIFCYAMLGLASGDDERERAQRYRHTRTKPL